MTLGNKLGKAVQQDTLQVRKITIDLGETKFDLRVKVPLKKQIEDINARIFSPSTERTEAIYQRLSEPMLKTLQEGGEDFVKALGDSVVVVKDDDFGLREQLTKFGYNATDRLLFLIAGDGYRDLRFFGGGIRVHEFNGGDAEGSRGQSVSRQK